MIPRVMVTSSGAAIATTARRRTYERICLAPCDALVSAGEHRFGISLGDSERVVPIPGVHRLTSATRLDLSFTSHDGERIAGWVVLGLGVARGLALALGNLLAQAFQIRGGWSATPENVAQVVAGGVVVTAVTDQPSRDATEFWPCHRRGRQPREALKAAGVIRSSDSPKRSR